MSSMDFDRPRDAAIEALRQGWRVAPGAYLNTKHQWMGDDGRALGLATLDPTGRRLRDAEDCRRQWVKHPYSVLAACGVTFDVALVDNKITAMRATHGSKTPKYVWAVSPTSTCGEVGADASVCAQLANAL